MQMQLAPTIKHQVAAMLTLLQRYSWNYFSIVTGMIAGHRNFEQVRPSSCETRSCPPAIAFRYVVLFMSVPLWFYHKYRTDMGFAPKLQFIESGPQRGLELVVSASLGVSLLT